MTLSDPRESQLGALLVGSVPRATDRVPVFGIIELYDSLRRRERSFELFEDLSSALNVVKAAAAVPFVR